MTQRHFNPLAPIALLRIMKPHFMSAFSLALGLAMSIVIPAAAQQHRATRLGNPATRFAPPLASPEDLRARFSDPKLKPDIALILHQWGWRGDLDDLFRAALSTPVTEIRMPVGTRMPFMSSRENGKPVALRDVLWAGDEPIYAYVFEFASKGRRYRCVTPRPCSNFFLEDLGAPQLALTCNAPAEVPVGRPVKVCLSVSNTGDAAESKATISLPVPEGAADLHATANGTCSASNVTWEIRDLGASNAKELCAIFNMPHPAMLEFAATATGTFSRPTQSKCETRIFGIPGLLIDAVDLEDPVEVGHEVTYDIKVTNQGTATCTNVRLICTLPESEEFVSGSGPTAVRAQERTLTTEPLASFAPKTAVTWRVIVKALAADDARFKVNLYADELQKPIYEEEPTHLY
jgi:uncharacterized repeat protein (TIGR01451 family)